ncbi:MAG: hypothetical protein C4547_16850 [Phycisphaerales bacterium]|nr:MAG: hypothetical protein C4547_16850 [Phycisphaerales bacterium]
MNAAPAPISAAIRAALAATSAIYVIMAVSGLTWGLPTARWDPLLFGGDPPWTGARLYELAGAGWTSAQRGADVDADPLGSGAGAARLTDSPEAVAAIYLRYRLYTHQPDEMIVMRALGSMRPGEGDFDPKLYQYGGAFLYPIGALLKAGDVAGLLDVRSDVPFYLDHPDEFGRFYLVSRGYAAAWGLIGVGIVFAIASRLGGHAAGVLASLGFALLPVVICMSHEGKPHLPGAVLMLAAVWFAMRWAETGARRDWWLLCVACGAALGMVLSSLPIFVLIPLAAWMRRTAGVAPSVSARAESAVPPEPGASAPAASEPRASARADFPAPPQPAASIPAARLGWVAQSCAGVVGAALIYLLLNPYVVINVVTNRAVLKSNFGNSLAMYEVSRVGEGLMRVAELTAEGSSLPVAVVGALALAAAVVRRRRDVLPLAVPALTIVVQFVLLGAGKPAEYGRFGVFVDAALMIGAACLILSLRRRTPVFAVGAAAVLIFALSRPALQYHANFRADATDRNSRVQLAADVNAQARRLAAEGRRLTLVVVAEPAPYACPPVDFSRIDVLRLPPGQVLPSSVDPAAVMGVAATDDPQAVVMRWGGDGFYRVAAVPGRTGPGPQAGALRRAGDVRLLSPISWANKPFEIMLPRRMGDNPDEARPTD